MEKIEIRIDGMMCTMCEAHINDLIRNNFFVKHIKSNHKKGVCIIETPETIKDDDLINAFKMSGYQILEIYHSLQ